MNSGALLGAVGSVNQEKHFDWDGHSLTIEDNSRSRRFIGRHFVGRYLSVVTYRSLLVELVFLSVPQESIPGIRVA
jgi:hypothetical protein